ncbi:MAG: beta-propeller domain-containing protein [Acidimicrobiales bacterium]|nr:beta-propeller domain-containing protein [Acidimicrobiales bacterium]
MKKYFISILLSLGMVLGACSDSNQVESSGAPIDLGPDNIELVTSLVPFSDCDELLSHLKEEAKERVGPYGLNYQGGPFWGMPEMFRVEEMTEMDAASAEPESTSGSGPVSGSSDAGGSGDDSYTGTNVQEVGVDEPDIIKTDGSRILIVNNGVLSHIEIEGSQGTKTDQIEISDGWGHELFISGNRALLFTNGGGYDDVVIMETSSSESEDMAEMSVMPGFYIPMAHVIEIDLSDPYNLQIIGEMKIEGQYLSARLVGGTVRMAINSAPNQLEWVYPSSPGSEDRATRFNKELIDETTIEDWTPRFTLTKGETTSSGSLLACEDLHRPESFSGFDVVSVLSFNIADGLTEGSGVGVLASGQTVYSSLDRFYVATSKWMEAEISEEDFDEWSESYSTDVHAFSISTDAPAQYSASGIVQGTLLNQFSMDEHDGYLRIITTTGSPWNDRNLSESQLVVFEEQESVLKKIGQAGGLGKGESLYSARLLDDIGFAVTFRQIDPFYVLDLSDPTDPEIVGELKIPGFSTYLHPIDENYVVGIGQNATDEGRVLGLKVSLFDVSDKTDPRETATWTMNDANSPAEWDHRAFQIYGQTIILPVQSWSGKVNGAVLLEIGEGKISYVGEVTHETESSGPVSDCRELTSTELEGTELQFWIGEYGQYFQLCSATDIGGYENSWCESILLSEIDDWYGDEISPILEEIGAQDGDRIEECWVDPFDWNLQIQRSLIINDVLWTMSWGQLQSNLLDGLETKSVVPIG